ncbi:MAG TPA: ABC transporter substrate-binding protein [Casimicrobiaceae bacterium]|nr:ABC transporter substrate-binding protein [Casimicrobiaceae bacterium]
MARRFVIQLVILLVACAGIAPRPQAQTIKLGEINEYKQFPAFLEPYRKGMALATDEINAAGGVLGRKIEVVSRDDNGVPGDAVRAAEELLTRENAALLMGTFASNIGLAVADLAKRRHVLFIAAEPLTDKLVWEDGNKYTFRLRASTYMQTAMLVPEAVKLGKKRWAIVYPNYEYGQAASATFKQQMQVLQGAGLEFVEQAVPLGKMEPGAVVQALIDAKPDAIFSSLFGPDLARFVREGRLRGLFDGRPVFNLLGGEPEYLDPLKDETPIGWYVTGYPWYAIETPEHKRFRDAYQAKFNDYPRLGSVVGYSAVKSAAAALARAGSTDSEKLVAAMQNLTLETPFGQVTYRAIDHQSTMGAYVGRTAVRDGKGIMVDWRYADGKDYLPPDDVVRRLRPAD